MKPSPARLEALARQVEACDASTDAGYARKQYLGDLLMIEGAAETMDPDEYRQRRIALLAELAALDVMQLDDNPTNEERF